MRALVPRGASPWALAWVLAAAPVSGAPPGARLSSDIPPQSLAAALDAFGKSTGLSVDWPPDQDSLPSPGARAGQSLQKALKQLLRGTGLGFKFPTERSVHIYAQSESAAPAAPQPGAAPDPPLPEVVVTSPRWEQRVVRKPIDLVDWTGEEMQAAGIKGIADVGARTPQVAFDFFSSVGSGVYTNIIIRGVADRHGSATGIFFDDIPLPSARSNTFGRALPPSFDLRSIEVLRGPQGTLLGADTQGGAVRFVPNQPSLTAYTAQAHAEWATTERGAPSYEAGAAAGGPLLRDVLGFRFSAWRRTDGGYVDRVDPFTNPIPIVDANANRDTSQSARAVLTYAPKADSSWTISPSINYVSSSAHDSPSFFTYLSNPAAGVLDNGSLVPQPFNDRYYVGSLRIIGDTLLGQLDSRTSYYQRRGDLIVDDTESVKWSGPDHRGWGNPLGPAYPVSYANAVTTVTALRQSVLSQELRLSSHDLTWGASYYRTHDTEGYHVTGASIPLFLGKPLDARNATHTLETRLAGFAEVSKEIFRHFTLGAGLRAEHERYESAEDESAQTELAVYGGQPGPPLHASAAETIVAPKLTLLYQSGRNDRYYLLAARGYAPAGVDGALPTCFLDLQPYPSDSLWNYELGANLWFLEGRLSVDTAVFEERWNNGPTLSYNCLVTHIPGPAVSRGFNLRALGAAGEFLLRFEVSYTDAYYAATQSEKGRVIVNAGDALGTPPLVVSPWEVLGSLEKSFALRDGVQATLRAEDAFHSHNPGPYYTGLFQPSDFKPNFYAPGLAGDPATNLVNLRINVSLHAPNPLPALCRCAADEPASFDLALYLNNAFDAQPTLLKRNKGVDPNTLYYATTFRPRTVGLAGTWRF